ncbi:MAG: MotA/TolQ/ExbB proton channel family protein [Proteobacteria bacterium]|nr:MotA/TolQ/ExbB proton channel family protein [Pseudomonadota bacterium]
MKNTFRNEFVYQVFALLIAFIVVHAVYVSLIRPAASHHIQQEASNMAADPDYISQDSFYVVIKDYEQETCFILMLWALSILTYKGLATRRQNTLLEQDLLQLPDGLPIGIEDTRTLVEQLHNRPPAEQTFLLPRVLLTGIERFSATRNVQDVSTAVRDVCQSEGDRLESELSIIRYIAWAIPSVGFIGTVRGIGDALGQAHRAVAGDITGVTENLGVAFNSTFVALVISIILMFFIHQLQLQQERLILDSEQYADHWLIRKLRG